MSCHASAQWLHSANKLIWVPLCFPVNMQYRCSCLVATDVQPAPSGESDYTSLALACPRLPWCLAALLINNLLVRYLQSSQSQPNALEFTCCTSPSLEHGFNRVVHAALLCSSAGSLRLNSHMAPNTDPPEGVHHYDTADEAPFEISKYWHQRYEIFSKYDDGVWMTDDAWFGVTPEPVATCVLRSCFNTLPLPLTLTAS